MGTVIHLADRRAVISALAARLVQDNTAKARVSLGAPVDRAGSPARTSEPFDLRRRQIAGAIAYLKTRCILVTPLDREAKVRRYRVSGRAEQQLAEDVIALAAGHGFEVPRA